MPGKEVRMFSFLYLFGPGVISWLVHRYFSRGSGKDERHFLWQFCEILAYAMIVMALTTAVLEPSQGVSVTALSNGMLTVQYGTRALALSVALAAALGALHAAAAGKLLKNRYQLVAAGAVAAAALCILVYGTGVQAPDGTMKISTKPVRINNAYYDSDTPLYSNDSQEYFIQVRSLADRLGMPYEEKQTGLFQIRCSLGADTFTLDLLGPEKDYFKKDGELYVSLSRLGSLSGIHVHSNALLADGSVRQVIYIDSYAQPFQYDWTRYPYVAHALGGIESNTYTNSREAFLYNYNLGQRVFEADLRLTADGGLAVVHDLPLDDEGRRMTEKEFKKHKVQGRYTAMTFTDLAKLMKKYPDMYVVTDTKETEKALVKQQFGHIVEVGNKVDPEILKRIIPQIYQEEMYDTVMGIYGWSSMIYTLYALENFSEKEVVDFAYQRGIGVITTNAGRAQELFFHELYDRNIRVYMHTYNTPEDEAYLKMKGVWGLYTDFLVP